MKCIYSTSDMITCAKLLAPTIEDPNCKNLMIKSAEDIEKSVNNCMHIAKEFSKNEEMLNKLGDSTDDVFAALDALNKLLKDDIEELLITPQDLPIHDFQSSQR